ncbi:hypothetical protein [Polyangium mundeleinium]|uniref:Uncharacterized protein n=1 Tax=Polyangium mundeleinium TaxID=2995306 RepID=A0ABT5EYX5_9BACT|nr:hypothetical protein [Polyangium mundeleinium]MDC0747036.1 hypothetical protein [Polyangium mundeleinium]
MRLGILGPANRDLPALARAAQLLLDEVQVDQIIYLSDDGALDLVAKAWAYRLVDANPSEDLLYARAAVRCARATPEAIDAYVAAERARSRLRALTSIPSRQLRSIELVDGRVAVFVYDKGILDQDDIAAASLLVFGRSQEPTMKRIGSRMFVSPGPIGAPGGGMAVLEEVPSGGVRVEIRNASGAVTAEDMLGGGPSLPGVKMRVQDGKSSG